MRIMLENCDELNEGISLLAGELGLEIVNDDPRVTLFAERSEEDILCVSLSGCKAKITYKEKSRFFRGLATLASWLRSGKTEGSVTERPLFSFDGPMVDMSRNAVMNVKTVKFFMRKCALMGLNSFMLYTEDTYEIEVRPYFGYMRGRYTKDEIRELDAYAIKLGIELIPCIQVLGHLATHLRWHATAPYRDSANVLLVGAKETYELIDDMFKTISECFTSKRIHIGMDETKDLGTGAYLDKFGYRKRFDIFLDHLDKVVEMAHGYGLEPMMWSDMFYRMSAEEAGMENYHDYDERTEIPEVITKRIPNGVQQVFWDYYRANEEFYAVNIEKHKQLGENTMFAGGIRTWTNFAPMLSYSLENSLAALRACKKGGVKEVLVTIWDNGCECSLLLSLVGLAWYADFDYNGEYTEAGARASFENACVGQSYDDFMATELPTISYGKRSGVSASMVFNDQLLGIVDIYCRDIDGKYFADALERLSMAGNANDEFTASFDMVRAVTDLLINKCDFSVRAKKAYDKGDKKTLAKMAEECDVIASKAKALRDAYKRVWFESCKPFGWEPQDIRLGGVISRAETVKWRLLSYVSGEVSALEELEEERLDFGTPNYPTMATASIL